MKVPFSEKTDIRGEHEWDEERRSRVASHTEPEIHLEHVRKPNKLYLTRSGTQRGMSY